METVTKNGDLIFDAIVIIIILAIAIVPIIGNEWHQYKKHRYPSESFKEFKRRMNKSSKFNH